MKTETKVFGIIFIITIIILFGGVFLLSRGSSKPAKLTESNAVQIDYTKGQKIGSDSAKVKLVEFSDFQCPACRAFAPVVDELAGKYSDTLLFAYRHYPLSQHAFAKPAALAAEAAGQQGKFWEMNKLLFENQDRFSNAPWTELADQLKLDRTKFDEALNAQTLKDKIDRDETTAITLKLPGTPSFFLNGIRLNVSSPLELKTAVEKVVQ